MLEIRDLEFEMEYNWLMGRQRNWIFAPKAFTLR